MNRDENYLYNNTDDMCTDGTDGCMVRTLYYTKMIETKVKKKT